jgi:hypothetical protein
LGRVFVVEICRLETEFFAFGAIQENGCTIAVEPFALSQH